jgi:hypothetical protein
MTPDEAIAIVRVNASGRTRYEGCPDRADEVLVAEIERLRAIVDRLPKTADGAIPDVEQWIPSDILRSPVYWNDSGTIRETFCVYGEWFKHYSTREAAEAVMNKEPTDGTDAATH